MVIYNILYVYRKICLFGLGCHFKVKIIFLCIDLSYDYWLVFFHSITESPLCLENLPKNNFIIGLNITPWLFCGSSPADSSGGYSDGSTGLPTCFHWHQFSLKCELLGSGYSLRKYACSVFAVGLPEKQQEIILRFGAGWKGLWRLHLYVWKSCCWAGPVRKWVQRMTFTLHPSRAAQRHPTVNCWSWFDLNSKKPKKCFHFAALMFFYVIFKKLRILKRW